MAHHSLFCTLDASPRTHTHIRFLRRDRAAVPPLPSNLQEKLFQYAREAFQECKLNQIETQEYRELVRGIYQEHVQTDMLPIINEVFIHKEGLKAALLQFKDEWPMHVKRMKELEVEFMNTPQKLSKRRRFDDEPPPPNKCPGALSFDDCCE